MQYKVPQNVDIEDKVIGGLTLKQFTYLALSGGIVLVIYTSLGGTGISFMAMPLSVIFAGFGVALAFIKINERPFEVYLGSLLKTFLIPSKRVWQKEILTSTDVKDREIKPKEVAEVTNFKDVKSNLQKLALLVDSGPVAQIQNEDTVKDILHDAENKSDRLNNLLTKTKEKATAQPIEAPVSAMASVETSKSSFKYESLQVKDEKELENMLEAAKSKQKAKEEELKALKINKF